jgi:hypothetical protein
VRNKLAFNDVPIRLVMRGKESRMMLGDKLEDNYGVEEDFTAEPLKKPRYSKAAKENKGLEDAGEDVAETNTPRGAPRKIGGPKKGVIKKEAPEKAPKAKAPPKKKKPDNKTNKGRLWKND